VTGRSRTRIPVGWLSRSPAGQNTSGSDAKSQASMLGDVLLHFLATPLGMSAGSVYFISE